MLKPLIWSALEGFCITLLLTPICRDVFRSYGVVDQPDQGRKLHAHPIPRVGGIAIALSYLGALLLITHTDAAEWPEFALVWRLLPGAAVIFAVGVIDDLLGLKPWQKLLGQIAGATLAYGCGVRISHVSLYPIDFWWAFPLTILWLLVCTNAFNLVDGVDGLAAGMGLLATLTAFFAGLMQYNTALALVTLPLAGCLLGFLCYNFNRATIFLGDSGSLLIGFLLGCYGVIWTQKTTTVLAMAAPLMAVSVPVLDMILSVMRRALRRRPIFEADRGHIHHRLLDRGLSPRRTVLVLYGIGGTGALFALLQGVVPARFAGITVLLFCFVAWAGIEYLGYAEFDLARRILFGGGFQRTLEAQLFLQNFEKTLAHARTPAAHWDALREISAKLGFSGVFLHLSGATYGEALPGAVWNLRVRLSETDYVTLYHGADAPDPLLVAPFANSLRKLMLANQPILEEPSGLAVEAAFNAPTASSMHVG